MNDVDFGLGEDLDLLRNEVGRFAAERIAPRAAVTDQQNRFPRELWPELGRLGLLGITVDAAQGGAGFGYRALVVAMEEISRASASVGLSYAAHSNLCVNQLAIWGTDEQRGRLLPDAGLIAGGKVMLEGRDIVSLSESVMRDVRGREMAMIFQEPATSHNPVLTVGQQIVEVLERHTGLRGAKARRRALELVEAVGIPDPAQRLDTYPFQLSGGMKQRVMIAIAPLR